jgi:DNA-binding NarL/FixJ family response regulator
MRILLADDESKVRSALRLWLAEGPGLDIVGEVEDVRTLFACLATVQPDVLLLDGQLPGWPQDGTFLQLLAAIRGRCPGLAIIGLSAASHPVSARPQPEVEAWVSKLEPPDQLRQVLKALQQAMREAGTLVAAQQ